MNPRLLPVLTLVVGLGGGAALALWLRGPAEPVPPGEAVAGRPIEVPLAAPPENPERLPRTPPEGLLPPEAKTHPEYFQDLEGEPPSDDAPEALPAEIDYARLEKLSAESDVPHRTLGAWDESPEDPTPGQRRSFVVVVEPGLGDAELEALARDLHRQHADARILTVRIFDSEKGARRAGWVDGGALAHQHLVAQVHRNEALGLDVIRIRGRRIEP